MLNSTELAVKRVIDDMHANLGQELTIDDMARTAMFSKFHFTRIFRDTTGVSPGRFLSALRLQEAKRLLVGTSMSIADISSEVGYSSVGTFSSRFKICVGVAPSAYRELGGFTSEIRTDDSHWTGGRQQSLRGEVLLPPARSPGFVFIGLFPGCVPQGQPVRCAVLDGPGAYELPDVPVGTWHVLVHSVPYGYEGVPSGLGDDVTPSVGAFGPLTVLPDTVLAPADIWLRGVRTLDPPVLLALLDLRMAALEAVAG
ncbi:helix-turn-helix domain-containing protein [Streptomyces griseocarneus]|uniref:helix-turn-helix domain-containing protein n=1 Tax=Streptomyces griseocarneus TaxID=51201 RepID=UPI00198AD644|nr:AraC family transcriptional regulator [Streptomyces griseocarneus]MBZ6477625.1 AraC family transcriptional regulator [Streptomyces griseocarneus]GHG83241.1 AraC family transcriptional regulator [Streptomyces griseocarneus]